MGIKRLLSLPRILGVHGTITLLKYVLLNREVSLNIHGKDIVLQPMEGLSNRLKFGVAASIEAMISRYVEDGHVRKAARLLGLDDAWFEDESMCTRINDVKLCAPREHAVRLLYMVREVFVKKIYGEPTGMNVIDIGAWMGETSIYFALHNKLVVGLEPVRRFYAYFRKNIEINNLSDRVVPINAAYSLSNSYVKILEDGLRSRIHSDGDVVKAVNLQSIIEEYNMDNVFLKVDCEGCEYELVNELPAVKEHISSIAIEVHKDVGDSTKVIEKIRENGFSIRKVLENPTVIVLYCTKKE